MESDEMAASACKKLHRMVREKADRLGLSMRRAAEEMSVTASGLSRLGKGKALNWFNMVKVCGWVGVDPRELVRRDPGDAAAAARRGLDSALRGALRGAEFMLWGDGELEGDVERMWPEYGKELLAALESDPGDVVIVMRLQVYAGGESRKSTMAGDPGIVEFAGEFHTDQAVFELG